MVAFRFTVNDSFLSVSTHPITVPRSQVNYKTLESAQLDRRSYTIIYPKGERLPGRIYSGEAGYGPYYQLTVHANPGHVPRYLKQSDKLFVLLARISGKNYAILEYRE